MNELDRLTLRQIAALMRYPDEGFAADPFGYGEGDRGLDFIPATSARVLRSFLLKARPQAYGEGGSFNGLERLRRDYVQTFDFDSQCNLHLAWHRYGDRPELGRALAGLNELYRDAGFELAPGELPDYLPRLLEFASVAPDWAVAVALDGFGDSLRKLTDSVVRKHPDSAYAPLLVLTIRLLGLIGKNELARRGAAGAEPRASRGAQWEERLFQSFFEPDRALRPRLALQAAPPRQGIECRVWLAIEARTESR